MVSLFAIRPPCELCTNNSQLKRLLGDIISLQHSLKHLWLITDDVHVKCHLFDDLVEPSSGYYLLNAKGVPTVIPSYAEFDICWTKQFYCNPFDANFHIFDIHDEDDCNYLLFIIYALEERLDFWRYDVDTKDEDFIKLFLDFIKKLRGLLDFIFVGSPPSSFRPLS